MLITLLQIEKEALLFEETVEAGAVDFGSEIEQKGLMKTEGRADLVEEHHGPKQIVSDIRLRAVYEGRFTVPCARCLEPVEHAVKGEFDLIFRPLGVDGGGSEHSITDAETEIGYYQKDGLLLEDVLREQVLLSLPAKTLCREDCKGLCPSCGRNRNSETCTCETAPADPRWSALSDLSSRLKS
jgi:uncharacterized protein